MPTPSSNKYEFAFILKIHFRRKIIFLFRHFSFYRLWNSATVKWGYIISQLLVWFSDVQDYVTVNVASEINWKCVKFVKVPFPIWIHSNWVQLHPYIITFKNYYVCYITKRWQPFCKSRVRQFKQGVYRHPIPVLVYHIF